MKRLLSVCLFVAAAFCARAQTAPTFPFTFYIHDTTGVTADYPLPSIYQYAATPVGSNSNIVIKGVNTSAAPAYLGSVFVTADSTSTVPNINFTITGIANDLAVPIGGSFVFTVNFSPTVLGPITAYLQTTYQVQQNGCDFTSMTAGTQCPGGLNVTATLTGLASQPQLVLSYQATSGNTVLQPSGGELNFGDVSVSGSFAYTFTLSNESTLPITVPAISVPAPTTYTASPFLLDASQVPATLAAGTSANFTVTFEPGQIGLATTYLDVGSNSYPIQGEGIVVADVDALEISYADNTGVRSLPQAATPISFGQVVAGTGGSNVLTFTVTNPTTSFNGVTVTNISVTGSAFTLGAVTGVSVFPVSIAPGASIGFQLTFTPTASGNYSGSLNIGGRVFTLAGASINSPLPSFTLDVTPSPLTSQQQATVAIQLASASSLSLTGLISMAFSPSVADVTDDPAIMFLGNSGRQLSLTVNTGAEFATYNGQSNLSFQTGTTAGTITFTVTFPNTPTFTKSFAITPTAPVITSATAVRSSPNLVVTLTGYDNTYSAGQLNFTFFDTSGNQIAPIALNAASNFQQLFFNNNTGGGAFSLQATFPVTGDVTKVGSVAVTLNNSAGPTNSTLNFQ